MLKCPKCNKCFIKKYDLNRHLDQKRKCVSLLNYKSKSDEIYSCEYCQSTFTTPYSLKRHVKNPSERCLMMRKLNNIEEKLNEQRQPQTIINQNTTINQTINNGPTINVNIQLVAPGEERIDHITDETLLKILNNNDFSTVLHQLMRHVYFNKDAPENSHWCIAYPKDKYGALQYNTETAIIERMVTTRTVNKHYENMLVLLSDRMNQLMRNGNLEFLQLRNINRFYQYVGTDNIEEETEFEDVKMMAYNNRHIPVGIWNKLDIKGEHEMIKK